MVVVRFELTTNDPWSVDDAICEGISLLGYWQKVNQSPTQTKPYNSCKSCSGFRQLRVRRHKLARGRDVIDLEEKLRSGLGFGRCFCRQ